MKDQYKAHEKIAGRDAWYKVLWYRFLIMLVDILSMASVFAAVMTIILYKSFKLLVYMIDGKVAPTVLVSFIGLILIIFVAFIFAYTYLCARKYTPPIVEALAMKISGGHDINVPAEKENGNGKSVTPPTTEKDVP